MRVLSLARVLFALLAFQLAVGLQIGVAHAAAMPMTVRAAMPAAVPSGVMTASTATTAGTDTTASTNTTASAAPDDACPLHGSSSHSASSDGQAVHSAPHAKVPQGTPAGKHDCCKSSGCQGQCGTVPLAFNIALSRNSPVSTRVQPAGAERIVAAPADTHFRPPILS